MAVVMVLGGALPARAEGSWSETESPDEYKSGAAVRLGDGRVLAAGGNPVDVADSAEAEVYNHLSEEWEPEDDMNHARASPRMVRLAEEAELGEVMVGGGFGVPPEVYDPEAEEGERWVEVAPAPMETIDTLTLLEGPQCGIESPPEWCGMVLATGTAGFTVQPVAAVFDLTAGDVGRWHEADVPERGYVRAVRLDGKPCEEDSWPEWCGKVLAVREDSAEVFDPNAGVLNADDDGVVGEWKPTEEPDDRGRRPSMVGLASGDVLVAGGDGESLTSAEIYAPRADDARDDGEWDPPEEEAWSETASLSHPRDKPRLTHLPDPEGDKPGRVLVSGGAGPDDVDEPDGWDEECSAWGNAELYIPGNGEDDAEFVSAGTMVQARKNHTATRLLDGRVLVVGGSLSDCGLLTAELYQPFAEIPVPDVAEVAPDQGLTDGGTKVRISGTDFGGASEVVFGGVPAETFTVESSREISATAPAHAAGTVPVQVTNDAGPSSGEDPDAAFSYHDEAGVWTHVSDLQDHARGGQVAAVDVGDALVIYEDDDGPHAERYDPQADELEEVAAPPVVPHVVAELPGGGVLVAGPRVIGGQVSTARGSAVYDGDADEWQFTATPPLFSTDRSNTVEFADGRVLVISRRDDGDTASQIYDPDTDEWDATDGQPGGHSLTGSRAVRLGDGSVLLTGGGANLTLSGQVQRFDPEDETWTDAPDMSSARGNHAVERLAGGDGLVTGGSGVRTRPGAEAFSPDAADEDEFEPWRAVRPMIHARSSHVLTRLADGTVLATGGRGRQHPTQDHEMLATAELFDPDAGAWRPTGRLTEVRRGHDAMMLRDDCGDRCGNVVAVGGNNSDSVERYTPRPEISGVEPAAGVVGEVITISGYGFAGVDEIAVDGVSADFTVAKSPGSPDSAAQITATVPSGVSAGSVAVEVTNQVATGDGATELVSRGSPAAQFTVVDSSGEGDGRDDADLDTVGQVDDLSAEAVSTTEIALGWSAVANGAGGVAGEYVVAQSLQPITTVKEFESAFALCGGVCGGFDPPPQTTDDAVELTVGDLRPGTTYHYAVAPVDGDGNRGPISDSVSATTAGDASSQPAEDGPAGQPGDGSSGAESVAGSAVRVSGSDRIATALAASGEAFEAGQAGAAVLARADVFADGLAGVPLAAAENGPLLLTHSTELDERVAGELNRAVADGGQVFLLGGQAALSDQVAQQVSELGLEPVRLAGSDRFATAAAIAEQGLGAPDRVLVATGDNFADAVTAGAAAARADAAVLLSAGDQLPQPTADYLDQHQPAQRYAVGGPAADAVAGAETLVGATRYETAAAVADAFFPEPTTAGLATGLRFPDALSGGAHIARYGGPMLLSGPDRLHRAASNYLAGHASSLATSVIYGGTAALDQPIAEAASAAISKGS